MLALFVAPVLLDAAFDASLRDLRDNWAPLAGLVVFAVCLTTAAVAAGRPCAVAGLALGAGHRARRDRRPARCRCRNRGAALTPPAQRVLTILEGESLLNDASALLIYRLAVSAVAAGSFSVEAVAPAFLLAVLGSIVAGPALGWLVQRLLERVQHIPTAIILQFVGTFAVWVLAESTGLSGVLTTVLLRHDARPYRPRADPRTDPHPHQRGLGHRDLRPQHLCFHLHRPADPPHP